jgi:hypothetical protein
MSEQNVILAKTIRTIGWSAIAISIIAIASESVNLLHYDPLRQLVSILRMLPQQHREELSGPIDAFRYNRIWSIYAVLYFIFVLIGAIQLVRFRASGRILLECAATVGILNACLDAYLNYILWKNLGAMMSSIIGRSGMSLENLNPFGMLSIAGSFALWIVPSILLIIYLRKPAVGAFLTKAHDAPGTK